VCENFLSGDGERCIIWEGEEEISNRLSAVEIVVIILSVLTASISVGAVAYYSFEARRRSELGASRSSGLGARRLSLPQVESDSIRSYSKEISERRFWGSDWAERGVQLEGIEEGEVDVEMVERGKEEVGLDCRYATCERKGTRAKRVRERRGLSPV